MLKWLVNRGWWLRNRYSPLRRGISLVFSLSSLVLIIACTDYVSQIEDRYGEWNDAHAQVSSSSITQKSSSSVAQNVVNPSTVVVGYITDSRDGQIYKTVTIGSQTWMAENLNYAYTGVPYNYNGYTSDSISWCYDDALVNCIKYGRLYTWAAAMDSAGTWSTNGKGCGFYKTCMPMYPVRGACPEGWHLPTKDEFESLFAAVGGQFTADKTLKSTSGWNSSRNGTDDYSFSALPAGSGGYDGSYGDVSYTAYFWSATVIEVDNRYAYLMYMSYSLGSVYLNSNYKSLGYSVRCVKD